MRIEENGSLTVHEVDLTLESSKKLRLSKRSIVDFRSCVQVAIELVLINNIKVQYSIPGKVVEITR